MNKMAFQAATAQLGIQ